MKSIRIQRLIFFKLFMGLITAGRAHPMAELNLGMFLKEPQFKEEVHPLKKSHLPEGESVKIKSKS